jgi:hypothetical protein
MTPRLVILFSILTALVLLTVALTAPVSVEGAAPAARPSGAPGSVGVHLGDGIVRLKVRAGERCGPVLALEIVVPTFRIVWSPRR